MARPSYKTFTRALGRRSPPSHDKLRTDATKRPGDIVLSSARVPWWPKQGVQ